MIKLMGYRKGFDIPAPLEFARWNYLPSVKELRKYVKPPDDYGFEFMLRDRQVLFNKTWFYLERVQP
jgi:hypothetical protein